MPIPHVMPMPFLQDVIANGGAKNCAYKETQDSLGYILEGGSSEVLKIITVDDVLMMT